MSEENIKINLFLSESSLKEDLDRDEFISMTGSFSLINFNNLGGID